MEIGIISDKGGIIDRRRICFPPNPKYAPLIKIIEYFYILIEYFYNFNFQKNSLGVYGIVNIGAMKTFLWPYIYFSINSFHSIKSFDM